MAYQEITRVFNHSKQKGAARLIMLAIAEHADTDGFAYPSADRLANYTNLSTRHTERVIAQLKDTPELYVLTGGGRWKSNRYVVLAGCDPDEVIRRVQNAHAKALGQNINTSQAKIFIVNKLVEIMSDVDQMSEYPSQETPTSGTTNTDISSKETPTSDPITPTSDVETPTFRSDTPTQESDEPSIEPSNNNQSVEPSKKIEPPERERQEEPKILSLIGYSDFLEKLFEITGRNPKLELHQSEVNPLAVEAWGAGYRIAELEAAAKRCAWMTTPPTPRQLMSNLGPVRPDDWMNHEEWIRDKGKVWLELGDLTSWQVGWLEWGQWCDYNTWLQELTTENGDEWVETEAQVGGD